MLPQYSTEELIANIKRRCMVPTSQLTYTTADFCALANDELQGKVVPLIMSTREEFFVDEYDVSTPADGVIEIPSTAVGAKLRSVCFVSQQNQLVMINLPRIDLDVVAGVGFSNMATLAGFYVQGNTIRLYPVTSVPVGSNLRLYFYKRALVLTDDAHYGQVTFIDTGTNTVVLSYVPSDWAIGTEVNAVSGVPNFAVTNALAVVVGVSSPSVILDSVTGIAVGDYISDLGFSAVPQVPVEAHSYLAQLTAAKCLEGQGDGEGWKVAKEEVELERKSLLIMISQRVDGSVKKVVNPTGGLRFLSGSGAGRWGGR